MRLMHTTPTRPVTSESGAILPLAAIVILMLLSFAAIGVDASAAYAERRQTQSEADAAVMAGALVYLDPSNPSASSVVDQVRSFASQNAPGTSPTVGDWQACTDPDKPIDYAPLVDSDGISNDCISLKQVAGEPALLRVRIPEWDMPTSFAGLIGVDTVAISATATAEIQYSDLAAVLPTSLPTDPEVVECLGSPPSGQLPPADAAGPCDGPTDGNFGLLNSPWFGAGTPHFTKDFLDANSIDCDDRTNRWEDRAAHGLALGLDHLIVSWPSSAGPVNSPGTADGPPAPTGSDTCLSASSGVVPYILNPQTGNTDTLEKGLIGNDASITAASTPGRLRQGPSPGSSGDRLSFTVTGWSGSPFNLDNVGLWEYIDFLAGPVAASAQCNSGMFPPTLEGRLLTDQMVRCLEEDIDQLFVEDLLYSPRFALVPVLNYVDGAQFGNKWWAITSVRPVYLHSTWYDCDPNQFCLFHPDDLPDLDPADPATYSFLFNPGESFDQPCFDKNNSGVCGYPNENKFELQGLSALVLEWDELWEGAENQLGGVTPFEVFLHTNE